MLLINSINANTSIYFWDSFRSRVSTFLHIFFVMTSMGFLAIVHRKSLSSRAELRFNKENIDTFLPLLPSARKNMAKYCSFKANYFSLNFLKKSQEHLVLETREK